MKCLIRSSILIMAGFLIIGFVADLQKDELPKMDLHVHLNYGPQGTGITSSQAYENASALSKKMGITFGIAEEFGSNNSKWNDSTLLTRIALAKKYNLYLGLQVNRRDWQNIFSKENLSKLDFILADALIFQNKNGDIIHIWIPGIPLGNTQEFMDLYVAHNLEVLSEPINIWANPTYLPDELISKYDELWTDTRMKKLIDAAVKNNVAIEINSRYMIPKAKFIKMAKAAGAHFTFGTNQHGDGIGEIQWSVNIAKECGLTKGDFFIPKRILSVK
jgi:histidinol phosphatase-like PHP family hydrolase